MDCHPDPVDPDVGDRVLFESQGVEFEALVTARAGGNLRVERRVPEDIVVEQVTEIVVGGDDDE